jgi:hypothetical protein
VLLEAQPEETAVIVSADVLNRLESIEALKQQVLDSLKA